MRYFILTIIAAIILFCANYAFILSVDPYDKYGWNSWHLKSKAFTLDRENKFIHVDSGKIQYEFFLLGSSRIQRLDPDLAERLTAQKAYNYGVENANVEDLLAMTRHIIDKHQPKTLYLLLDFYMLNSYIGVDKRTLQSHLGEYLTKESLEVGTKHFFYFYQKSYTTLEALRDSFMLLYNNKYGTVKNIYKENGRHIEEHAPEKPRLAIQYFTNQYVKYSIDKGRLEMLGTIKKLCEKHNIRLIAAISPENEEHVNKTLDDKNLRKNFFEFKRAVTSELGEVYDFNNYSVREYDGYPWWYDSVHPTEKLADIMITKLLAPEMSDAPDGFGIKLTKDNIEDYISKKF